MTIMSRRSFAILAGLSIASLAAGRLAAAPSEWSGSFSIVQVDVSDLESGFYDIQAEWIRVDLSRALAQYFPARGPRDAPALIVTLHDMNLGDYAGGHGSGTDYLYGDAMIVARDRTILQTYPIRLTLTPQGSGRWDLPDIDRRRVHSLAEAFAGWVARYVNRN